LYNVEKKQGETRMLAVKSRRVRLAGPMAWRKRMKVRVEVKW